MLVLKLGFCPFPNIWHWDDRFSSSCWFCSFPGVLFKISLWVADYISQSFPFTRSISNGDAAVLFQELIIFCIHPSRIKREGEATQRETFPLQESFSSEVKPHSWLANSPSQHLNSTAVILYFQQQQLRHQWDWHAFTTSSSKVMILLQIFRPGSQTMEKPKNA